MRMMTWPVRSWKSCAMTISISLAWVCCVCCGTAARKARVSCTRARACGNSSGWSYHCCQRSSSAWAPRAMPSWMGPAASVAFNTRLAACSVICAT
ncbi:Uncharacterised protein [Bordetella pertussis]|nr:Uncharacterised protein [Bordetella pertussis]